MTSPAIVPEAAGAAGATLALHVSRAAALERRLERAFATQRLACSGDAAASGAIEVCQAHAAAHRAALESHLARLGATLPDEAASSGGDGSAGGAYEALIAAHALLGEATAEYIALLHVAFLLFDPPLRAVPLPHLRDYVQAAQGVREGVAAALTRELRGAGLVCRCTCPACTVGACACVLAATDDCEKVWREAVGATASPAALPLEPPRSGSPLEGAPARPGDLLVAVDGAPLAYFREVNALLGKHPAGEPLRLTFLRDELAMEVQLPAAARPA